MINIQYICDNCGEFDPYLPSKSSSITCSKCNHNEKIPEPTKINKYNGYKRTWSTVGHLAAYLATKIAERQGNTYVIIKDITTNRIGKTVDDEWDLLNLDERVCIRQVIPLINSNDVGPSEMSRYECNFDPRVVRAEMYQNSKREGTDIESE